MAAKVLKGQQPLFEPRMDNGSWKPTQLPDLSGHKNVWLDCTTTGNKKHCDKAVSIAICTEDKSYFIPWGFEGGGNMDPEQVKDWAKRELRNKRVANLNTGFDAETLLNAGIDLEGQGCVLHDVAHSAALLNENRYGNEFTLDKLGQEYVGGGKLWTRKETPIKPENHHKCHSSLIAEYEMRDAELARDIDIVQRPLIEAEGLGRVENLEDLLIWPNNHMERNGLRLDLPKMAAWRTSLDEEYSELLMQIWEKTGVKMRPNTPESWGQLFDKIGMDRNKTGEWKTPKGKSLANSKECESYTDAFLKKIDNDLVKAGLRMRRLSSLKSKYIEKYWKARRGDMLPFHLYQLRASEDDYGTVVGRYSSANVNIQQLFKVENQIERFGLGYIIRELIIPDNGFQLVATDGSQLQFRLFAHYSRDKDLIEAYKRDLHLKPGEEPVDFHAMVAGLFGLSRQAAKHNNFAMVLGMGREKLADRLNLSCECRDREWWSRTTRYGMDRSEARAHYFGENDNHASDCPARKSNDMADEYEKKFPAAKKTMKKVSETAEERGYLMTLLGRRRRFKAGDKFYSGFASLLQGSEADVVKSKILTVYRERKTIGIHKLRCPVHDELVSDIDPSPKYRKLYEECCRETEIPLSVPLIWNSGYGKNWKETK